MSKKKILAAFAVLAACFAMSTGSASADKVFSTTCGTGTGHYAKAVGLSYNSSSTGWTMHLQYNCPNNGSFEFELQRSTNGGTSWFDTLDAIGVNTNDFQYAASTANGDVNQTIDWYFGLQIQHDCVSGNLYRVKVYDANGNTIAGSGAYC